MEPRDRSLVQGRRANLRPSFNLLDIAAVTISLLCLAMAVVTIVPSLPYAARLGYTRQIIIIGLLVSIMKECLKRPLKYLLLVLEERIGRSSLQNYSALLEGSPLAPNMDTSWRLILTLFIILPLALSALYKQYTGGVGTQSLPDIESYFSPTVLPGLEKVSGLSMMANATIPYLNASAPGTEPPDFAANKNVPYGYNIIVISNTSAAALDIPMPQTISRLQNQLRSGEIYYLGSPVNGTVVTYNATAELHRDDADFWFRYTSLASLQIMNNYDGSMDDSFFGMLAQIGGTVNPTSPANWDSSWVFLGNMRHSDGVRSNADDTLSTSSTLQAFQQKALGFEVHRHACNAMFKITRSSVELVEGSCSPEPLPWQYQYYKQAQPAMTHFFFSMIQQNLGRPFCDLRTDPRWRIPSYAVTMASAFHIRIASANNTAPIRPDSNLTTYWEPHGMIPFIGTLNTTYLLSKNTLQKSTPTLLAHPTLYIILAIQPLLTLLAFIGPFILFCISNNSSDRQRHSVLPRQFSFIAILAGLRIESLIAAREDKNSGMSNDVAITGELKLPLTMKMALQADSSSDSYEAHGMEEGTSEIIPLQHGFETAGDSELRYMLLPG
jgi:hypothetical protein